MSDDATPGRWLALGRRTLAQQPFSQLLGTELVALSEGRSELALPLAPQLLQQNGFAHGGVVSYLADNALTFCGGSAMREPVVTAEFKINYVRPAVGVRLLARADAVAVGKTLAVCRCDVIAVAADGSEKLCAVAQGTVAPLRTP